MIVEPRIFPDARGLFFESWSERRYAGAGIGPFLQDNVSISSRGVVRGLHFQNPNPQAKLITVLAGEIFDVAIDIRRGSPSFGRHVAITLSAENHRQLYVPAGFAHGFKVVSDGAVVSYKCSDVYNAEAEHGIIWNDADLAIPWPVGAPVMSPKDEAYPRLRDVHPSQLLVYRGPDAEAR